MVCEHSPSSEWGTSPVELSGGGGVGGTRRLSCRLDTGDMKSQVDPHSARKLQTDQLWVDNLCDDEGSDEPGDSP